MSAADGIAVNHRDDGFWQTTNLHLHIKYTQTGYTLLVDIAATTFHMHVAS